VWTASRKVGNLTLDAGLRSVTWVVYLTVFLLVLRRALRTPTRAHQDIALFFGATVMLIGLISVETLPGTALPRWLAVGIGAVALTLPYLLLRLVAGFAQISPWVPCLRVRHLSDSTPTRTRPQLLAHPIARSSASRSCALVPTPALPWGAWGPMGPQDRGPMFSKHSGRDSNRAGSRRRRYRP
jgi:hypothetical protein